jgi:hypothetical protein
MKKTCLIAAAALVAGCSSILGFKDPTFQEDKPVGDAAIDSPITAIDAAIDAPTDAPIDSGPAACVPSACTFGCDTATNKCRISSLYLYATTALLLGDGFGGIGANPTVRATSDALCFDTASTKFPARKCDSTRTHAVLSVSTSDSLDLMRTKYGIPLIDERGQPVEVHRADDDAVVSGTWNVFLDPQVAPRVPPTTATTVGAATIWTGSGESSTCKEWTSEAAGDFGEQGNTMITSMNWLRRGATPCDTLAHLLCVCWPGGS